MKDTFVIDTISQAHHAMGLEKPQHPLVSIVKTKDMRPVINIRGVKIINNLYQIVFKDLGCGNLQYGRNSYDYEEGTLVFTAPGQVTIFEGEMPADSESTKGWTLAFHPDLIRKSDLIKKMDDYHFFKYDVNEALHVSEKEKVTIEDLLEKIETEYSQNLDRHSQHLIVSNIELLLDYCTRFYDRQFLTRSNLSSDLISRFENLLKDYYRTFKHTDQGIPTVQFCAEALHLSTNYLSDLLKKETGRTAQEHIHLFLINRAKDRLLSSTDSISEIGYDLGFMYPQHFSNLFKQKTGVSPRQYRSMN